MAADSVDSPQAIEQRGVITTVLEPGSCLFLPAGTFHRTVDQPEAALSSAIAIRPPSRLDLLVAAVRYGALSSRLLARPRMASFRHLPKGEATAPARAATREELLPLAERLRELSRGKIRQAPGSRVSERVEPSTPVRRPCFSRYLRVPSTGAGLGSAER